MLCHELSVLFFPLPGVEVRFGSSKKRPLNACFVPDESIFGLEIHKDQ